jgi:hypothetical protein
VFPSPFPALFQAFFPQKASKSKGREKWKKLHKFPCINFLPCINFQLSLNVLVPPILTIKKTRRKFPTTSWQYDEKVNVGVAVVLPPQQSGVD